MSRNATPSSFGWDFQVNAAIVLMLENIKAIKSVRVEGRKEDIPSSGIKPSPCPKPTVMLI